MKRLYWLILGLLFFQGSTETFAQKNYYSQDLYWIRYQNQLYFSPSVYWNNEFDNRRYFSPNLEAQFIFHSRLHKKIKRFDFGGGLTYSVAYTNRPENGYRPPRREIRPVIEGSHEFPFKMMFIQNRIRIDSRFLQSDPEVPLLEESDFVIRFRYRLQVRIPIVKNDSGNPMFTLKVSDEIMFNSNENFYDQNRVYILGDFVLNKNVTLEAGYIYIDQHAYGREEFYARNVLRFSVNHRINLK